MSDCCNDCEDLGLPVGETGQPGQPSFLAFNLKIAGFSPSNNTTTLKSMCEFPFSNQDGNPFTRFKANVWVTGGTGTLVIKDLVSGNTLYTNANITSTSAINLLSVSGLDIYNVNSSLISVQVKHNTGGANSIFISSIDFFIE